MDELEATSRDVDFSMFLFVITLTSTSIISTLDCSIALNNMVFLMVAPAGVRSGADNKAAGVYSTPYVNLFFLFIVLWNCCSPFVVGGSNGPPFPLVIQCSSDEAAQISAPLITFAEANRSPHADEVSAAACADDDFLGVCHYLDAIYRRYWVVTLGWRIGIFVNRCVHLTISEESTDSGHVVVMQKSRWTKLRRRGSSRRTSAHRSRWHSMLPLAEDAPSQASSAKGWTLRIHAALQ
jgi:hypothetical protein